MNYKRLIYKRKYSILGVLLVLAITSAKISYKIIKWLVLNLIKFIKWFHRYIQFVKSGYSYSEIYNLILYNMDGRQFEIFCYNVLKSLGYHVRLTQATNDYGRDIVISTNQGEIFIECKHYVGEKSIVGREICQKLLGSMQMFKAHKGIVITTGKVHDNVWECVKMVDNLEIWDMTDIMKLVVRVDQKKLPIILTKSLGTDNKIIGLNPVRN